MSCQALFVYVLALNSQLTRRMIVLLSFYFRFAVTDAVEADFEVVNSVVS